MGDYTYFTTYINQRIQIENDPVILMSQLDQTKVECRLQNPNVDSKLTNIKESLITELGEISARELTVKLELKLLAGKMIDGEYVEYKDEDIPVGENVIVRLSHIETTDFSFALMDCAATSDEITVSLYQDFCPNDDSLVVSLKWLDSKNYSLNLFRMGSANSMTFTCVVAVYPSAEDLPAACPARNRRSVFGLPVVAARKHRPRRSAESTEVAVSVHLEEMNNSAARNIIKDTILLFLMTFFIFIV